MDSDRLKVLCRYAQHIFPENPLFHPSKFFLQVSWKKNSFQYKYRLVRLEIFVFQHLHNGHFWFCLQRRYINLPWNSISLIVELQRVKFQKQLPIWKDFGDFVFCIKQNSIKTSLFFSCMIGQLIVNGPDQQWSFYSRMTTDRTIETGGLLQCFVK